MTLKRRFPIFGVVPVILCTLVLSIPGRAADAIDIDQLVSPFRGFDHAHMELVFDLFGQETQGRLLLRQARRKLNVSSERDLTEIFCFCEPADLGIRGTRRGLFTQETGNYYREKGESEWHALNPGGDEKLRDGERFPIVARREHQTRGFEFLDVAFLPRICIRRGLSVAQTYLVLFPIVIYFDELVQVRYMEAGQSWPTLQGELYQIDDGGVLFYETLDGILRKPQTMPFIHEVFYFCLSHGFRGRYNDDPVKITEYMERLKEKIPVGAVEIPIEPPEESPQLRSFGSPAWYYSAAGALLLLGYLALKLYAGFYVQPI